MILHEQILIDFVKIFNFLFKYNFKVIKKLSIKNKIKFKRSIS